MNATLDKSPIHLASARLVVEIQTGRFLRQRGGRGIFGAFARGMQLDNNQSSGSGWCIGRWRQLSRMLWYDIVLHQSYSCWNRPFEVLKRQHFRGYWDGPHRTTPISHIACYITIAREPLNLLEAGHLGALNSLGAVQRVEVDQFWCCSVVKTHMFNSLSIKSIHIP